MPGPEGARLGAAAAVLPQHWGRLEQVTCLWNRHEQYEASQHAGPPVADHDGTVKPVLILTPALAVSDSVAYVTSVAAEVVAVPPDFSIHPAAPAITDARW
jgi:hypothetical protein